MEKAVEKIRHLRNYTNENLKLNILIIHEKVLLPKKYLFRVNTGYYLIVKGSNIYVTTLHKIIRNARKEIKAKDNIIILDKNLSLETMYKM